MTKFSIRDLFLVTAIVALVLGWWVDHRYQRIQLRESEAWRHRAAALADHLLHREKLEVVWRDVDVFVRRQDGMGSTLISAQNVTNQLRSGHGQSCPLVQHPPQTRPRIRHGWQTVPLSDGIKCSESGHPPDTIGPHEVQPAEGIGVDRNPLVRIDCPLRIRRILGWKTFRDSGGGHRGDSWSGRRIFNPGGSPDL